jgi:uncharacterized membrane protein (DUF4010 family)
MAGEAVFLELRPLWEAMVALGLGLLIGLERENNLIESAVERPYAKGARSFSLIALFGYASALLGESVPALPVLAVVSLVILLAALHFRMPSAEDVTTEVAALLTALIGMLVRQRLGVAVLLGLLCAVILIAKPWTHLLASKVRRMELLGTLQLLLALAILLPVMPDRPLPLPRPLHDVLNPRSIVLFILLIAAVSYVGYFMTRILGARRGLSLAGFIGGFASSTAVTLAMAERARETPNLTRPAAQAATLASTVMVPRVLLVVTIVHAPLAAQMLWPLLAAGAGYLVAYLLLGRARDEQQATTGEAKELPLKNPFELVPALKFGLMYVVVIVVAKVARIYLGVRGLYLASGLAGLADVDSIALATTRLTEQGELSLAVGATSILIAVAANTLSKSGLALSSGGRAYGKLVLFGHALAVLCGALALVAVRHFQ